ncbi:MAG: NAD-dependent dehydratase [Deltaproteobacteria bacterium HGW-Deltaproteobacteria-15]|nr:MAG: NAD-dependent dehydratase [Deltaproteobacteria bacterium HGW-Deltaproteobacteria-15]
MEKSIIVFGGDGFCGWPTSLGLSKSGYDVTIVDNLSRRKIDLELECESLTPIRPISTRLQAWKALTGKDIKFVYIDAAEHYHRVLSLIKEVKPMAIIHFAEQRAAPYSMKSAFHKRYTVDNNLNATHNILCAIVESGLDVHLVHLGTMGVYGYGTAGMEIPEGYLKVFVDVDGVKKSIDILYPANPGSIYHLTKTQDALFFYYYNKNDRLRITDLHQGIVWGTNTPETMKDEALINRFDYDGDYGTVLNRFLMQAAVGHPLTVHGTGGQTRAFIHIRDTVNCIRLAVENPPQTGDRVKIFNQATETHTVRDLAKIVSDLTGAEIRYYMNPRSEDPENRLRVSNHNFLKLGLNPITLQHGLMNEVMDIAKAFKSRCDVSKIICTSTWRPNMQIDFHGSTTPLKQVETAKEVSGFQLKKVTRTNQGEGIVGNASCSGEASPQVAAPKQVSMVDKKRTLK